jgi:hypothetical protein
MSAVDLSDFERLSAKKSGAKPCAVRAALESLPPDEQEKLAAALEANPNAITPAAISKWLEARECAVTWQAVRTHRKKECRCGKE